MVEHNVVGEERDPFVGRSDVGGAAADQFVAAIVMPDQFGFAELLDDLAGGVTGDELIQFHAAHLTRGGGTLAVWVK